MGCSSVRIGVPEETALEVEEKRADVSALMAKKVAEHGPEPKRGKK